LVVRRLGYFGGYLDDQIREILDQLNIVIDNSIIETGSNANGYYRKWADGTLECWGTKDLGTFDSNTPWGSLYVTPIFVLVYPATFTFIDDVNVSPKITTFQGGVTYFLGYIADTSATNMLSFKQFYLIRPDSKTNYSATIGFYAIGRWKA